MTFGRRRAVYKITQPIGKAKRARVGMRVEEILFEETRDEIVAVRSRMHTRARARSREIFLALDICIERYYLYRARALTKKTAGGLCKTATSGVDCARDLRARSYSFSDGLCTRVAVLRRESIQPTGESNGTDFFLEVGQLAARAAYASAPRRTLAISISEHLPIFRLNSIDPTSPRGRHADTKLRIKNQCTVKKKKKN